MTETTGKAHPPEGVRPVSATHAGVAFAGLVAFLVAVMVLRVDRPFGNGEHSVVHSALFLIGVTAGTIFLLDLLWQKVHLRASTGLDFGRDDPSWQRSLTKLAGLMGSLGFVALLYWLLPEYHGAFYDRYYQMLRLVLPPWLVLVQRKNENQKKNTMAH